MTEHLRPSSREDLVRCAAPDPLVPEADADVALLAGLLAAPAIWAELDPALEDDVVHGVMHARPARPSSVTRLRPRTAHRRRVRRWSISSAAAAVAVVALVGGLALRRTEEHPDFKTELTATALAPNAGAEVEMYHSNAGFRVTLDARGLAALPPGEYYQAWLRNEGGAAVPIGSFSSSDGHVTLWSGVSAKDFPNVSVTIEPADNDPTPSNRRVLTGVLRER
jgi:hypothetical protein